jgi:hypothetical protein
MAYSAASSYFLLLLLLLLVVVVVLVLVLVLVLLHFNFQDRWDWIDLTRLHAESPLQVSGSTSNDHSQNSLFTLMPAHIMRKDNAMTHFLPSLEYTYIHT